VRSEQSGITALPAERSSTVTATFHRVAVLGLGLIGGSMLQAVRHSGIEVVGYDNDPVTAGTASASRRCVTR
jgi:prephenate dehydrogenase